MDNFIYVNACKTTLAEGITAGQTVISVSNPAPFPASIPIGHVLVLVLHPDGLPSTQEIVHCTAIAAGVLTVVRGAQDTTPASWAEGTVVGAYLTAEMLAQIAADVNGHAGSGGSAHAAASTTVAGFMAAADKVKLNGIATGATAYTHPANHPASVITQDASSRFASDTEKGNWNAAKNHADSAHAPSTAQKNSDILKSEIEAKLTGSISSHAHAGAEAATPSTLVQRDAAGDIHCRLLRPNFANEAAISGALAYRIDNGTNSYLRFCSNPAAVRAWLGAVGDIVLSPGSLVYAADSVEATSNHSNAAYPTVLLGAMSSEGAIGRWFANQFSNLRAIKMYHAGTVTVSFAAKKGLQSPQIRLVQNSTQLQEWNDLTTSYITRTRTVTVAKGDTLMLQGKDEDSGSILIKDFQILVAVLP